MVVTEPLSDAQWSDIAITTKPSPTSRAPRPSATDSGSAPGHRCTRHHLPGGRPQHALADTTSIGQHRQQIALNLFPQVGAFTHNWGGSVGVARSRSHVIYDPFSRWEQQADIREGVGASFLFGETLADLLTGASSALSEMPWVQRRAIGELRRWEPEPFPHLGLNATMLAFGAEEWLLDRFGEFWPTRAIGWLCDKLDQH